MHRIPPRHEHNACKTRSTRNETHYYVIHFVHRAIGIWDNYPPPRYRGRGRRLLCGATERSEISTGSKTRTFFWKCTSSSEIHAVAEICGMVRAVWYVPPIIYNV